MECRCLAWRGRYTVHRPPTPACEASEQQLLRAAQFRSFPTAGSLGHLAYRIGGTTIPVRRNRRKQSAIPATTSIVLGVHPGHSSLRARVWGRRRLALLARSGGGPAKLRAADCVRALRACCRSASQQREIPTSSHGT